MSFHFAFAGNRRDKLHELADRHLKYPHVPQAAVDFIKQAIDTFDDGTMLHVVAQGHKAQVGDSAMGMLPATMDVNVTPVIPTE